MATGPAGGVGITSRGSGILNSLHWQAPRRSSSRLGRVNRNGGTSGRGEKKERSGAGCCIGTAALHGETVLRRRGSDRPTHRKRCTQVLE